MSDGPDRDRDFLYRLDRTDGGQPLVHAISARPPTPQDPVWAVETKPYAPALAPGDRLEIRMRLNPTVRSNIKGGRGQRHDAIMNHKRTIDRESEPPAEATIVRDATWEWLTRRQTGHGIDWDGPTFMAFGYRRYEIPRPSGPPMQFMGVEVQGNATVRDPEAAKTFLVQGAGRGRGFGFGMPMVRRT